jgi:hypothetical protein
MDTNINNLNKTIFILKVLSLSTWSHFYQIPRFVQFPKPWYKQLGMYALPFILIITSVGRIYNMNNIIIHNI